VFYQDVLYCPEYGTVARGRDRSATTALAHFDRLLRIWMFVALGHTRLGKSARPKFTAPGTRVVQQQGAGATQANSNSNQQQPQPQQQQGSGEGEGDGDGDGPPASLSGSEKAQCWTWTGRYCTRFAGPKDRRRSMGWWDGERSSQFRRAIMDCVKARTFRIWEALAMVGCAQLRVSCCSHELHGHHGLHDLPDLHDLHDLHDLQPPASSC
jgi:hypothetical protein